MARPALLFLLDKFKPWPRQNFTDFNSVVPHDHQERLRRRRQRRVHQVVAQGTARQLVDQLGMFGFEARGFACGKNDDREITISHGKFCFRLKILFRSDSKQRENAARNCQTAVC